ncbi:MAG: hypothetical protein Q4B48_02875, partial [Syntrophomonadaceae bacterium]|nr:hypothetical protein [Syntrophomonadaceae bacterium]
VLGSGALELMMALALILREAEAFPAFRLLILPDHPTPIALKTHTREPVPFLWWDKQRPCPGPSCYNEATATASGLFYDSGPALIEAFIRD